MSSIDMLMNQLNFSSTIIVVSISIINFLIGGIGLTLNLIVFTRPSLRREPCSLYFFSSTCFNLFVVLIILPVRIVSNGFNIDLADYNIGICKTENFAFYAIRTISFWLIALACFDRCLHSSTNVHIRQLSSLKTAKRIIIITSILITLLYSHMIIYYRITNIPNQVGNLVPVCVAEMGIYRTFIAFWFMAWYSLCPSFIMFLFGFLTLNNLHRTVRRMIGPHQVNRRRDNQLLRMLTAQVLVIVLASMPFSIYRLYIGFSGNIPKNRLRVAQENVAFTITPSVGYFAHSSSFYLHTLTGKVFRKELIKFFRRYFHHNGTVFPVPQTEPLPMVVLRKTQTIPTAGVSINQKRELLY